MEYINCPLMGDKLCKHWFVNYCQGCLYFLEATDEEREKVRQVLRNENSLLSNRENIHTTK